MGTYETLAVVAAVYMLAFITHATTRAVEKAAPDEI